MKILIAAPYFYPSIGGLEKHLYELSKRLITNHGVEVVVVAANHGENKPVIEEIDGIKIYRLNYWFKISNTPINPIWYFTLKKIIKDEKPDLINGRGPVPFMADIAALVSGKLPFILGYHFPSMKDGSLLKDIVAGLYEKYCLPRLLKKSTALICSSELIKNTLFKNFKYKTIVVHQGIDFELFKPGKCKSKETLMFCGNYATEVKGLSYLIKAIPQIKTKYPNVMLKIIGKGNDKFYKQLVRELNIEDNVLFKGEYRGESLVKEYQSSNIFILPSVSDNLPSVILEAIACKVPVIATRVGNIPDIIKDGKSGLLINSKDENQITDSVIRLFNNYGMTGIYTSNAFNEIRNDYSWDKQAKITNDLFIRSIE